MTAAAVETARGRGFILGIIANLVDENGLALTSVQLYGNGTSARISVPGQAEVEAWAKVLGGVVAVLDEMPLAMHYSTYNPVPIGGWTISISGIILTAAYRDVSTEIQVGLGDKVRARAAEQATS